MKRVIIEVFSRNTRRIFFAALAFAGISAGIHAQSGTCGDGVNWAITGTAPNQTLTISYAGSGTGVMDDYANWGVTPWASQRLSLTTLVIDNGVTSIGNNAFYACSNLTGTLTIPNSVTTIGSSAFSSCKFTGTITIPNSVTTIRDGGFSFCGNGVTAFDVDAGNLNYFSDNGVLFDSNQTVLIQYPMGKSGAYTIPNTVTTIGYDAFVYCTGLTGITIPNSVTTIGNSAFENCSNLTGSLTIPNSVITIGDYAFMGCWGFTGTLTIGNSVTSIGNSAFAEINTFIGDLVIPNSVTTIGDGAFREGGFTGNLILPNTITTIGDATFSLCGFTGTLTLPNAVTSIGIGAFGGCHFTGDLIIPNTVTSIGNGAFGYGFTGNLVLPHSITSIEEGTFLRCGFTGSLIIPPLVDSIGNYAFFDCNNLTELIIPSSVVFIGQSAFNGCSGLTSIACLAATPPAITIGGTYSTFGGVTATIPVYVPCNSVGSYQTTWTPFSNYICQYVVNALSNDNTLGVVGGGGGYEILPSVIATLYAAPTTTAVFTGWTDGNTDNPRTITVTSDTTLTANFDNNNTANLLAQIADLETDTAILNSIIANLQSDTLLLKIIINDLQASLDSCLNGILSTKSIHLEDETLQVYPNPTTGQLTVVSSQLSETGGEVAIYDIVGQVVFVSALSSTSPETTIDISHLANGLYFLKVDGKMFKVVKQ